MECIMEYINLIDFEKAFDSVLTHTQKQMQEIQTDSHIKTRLKTNSK